MSSTAPTASLDLPVEDDVDVPDARPGSRLGLALAAVIAVAASAALAWWFAAPDRAADVGAPAPVTAPGAVATPPARVAAPLRFAAADPDPDQVRRAWNDVRQGYAEGGEAALVLASQACAKGVPTDPQRLDYCLAYDLYASAIAPPAAEPGQGDWFAAAGERDLALARTALPEGVSPGNRLAQIASLSKAVLPKAAPRPAQAVRAARHAARPKAVAVRRPQRSTALRPKHGSAAMRHPPRRARAPAADPTGATRDGAFRSIDDYLNRPPPGEDPFDPPH